MSAHRFSIGEAISFGWETVKSNIGFFIGLLIVAFLIENIPSMISQYFQADYPLIAALFALVSAVVAMVVQMGLIKVSLKFCDGIKGKLDDLLSTFKLLWSMFAASILYVLIVLAGFLLLIVPGVIWFYKYCLFPYFIVDKGLGPIAALKESGVAMEDAKWDIFIFQWVLFFINIAGALALFVGLFVTVPLSMVAYAYIYRTLSGGSTDTAQSSVPAASNAQGVMYVNLGY